MRVVMCPFFAPESALMDDVWSMRTLGCFEIFHLLKSILARILNLGNLYPSVIFKMFKVDCPVEINGSNDVPEQC